MKQKQDKGSGGNKFQDKKAPYKANFKKKQEAENPFDKFSNAKKKHEVLNRRVKGEDRNVGRARGKAIDERKTKLLKDYQSSKKSNSFQDKRFGESDANLSLEEKMFMRFQQERVKKVRNGSQFNLDTNDNEILTHKGQTLGESNIDDKDGFSSDEEDGGKLDREVVNKLHFGGGMVETSKSSKGIYGPADDEDEGGPRKGRLEALQEIVMKSKLHKLQKKEAKEEQEDERSKLDKDFDDMLRTQQIDIKKPEKAQRGRGIDPEDFGGTDAYDVSLREMAFESKVQPSNRTKTEEELAIEEHKRIEELEKARIRRMKYDTDPEAEKEAAAALGPKGIRGRKVTHVTDDMIDLPIKAQKITAPVEDSDDEEEGEGDDDADKSDADEESGESEGSEGESDEEQEDEEYSDDEEGDGDEVGSDAEGFEEQSGDEDEVMDYDEQEDDGLKTKKTRHMNPDDLSSDEDDYNSDADVGGGGKRGRKHNRHGAKKLPKYVEDGVNIVMPHKIDCPSDLEAFDALVAKYVRNDADMCGLIDRILSWNSVHLPGAQGATNKGLMHNFIDVLLKHFIRVGDSLGSEANDEARIQLQLDYLCRTIFALCQTVGIVCAALWGRTVKIMQSQLQKRLRDYSQGVRDSCWPSLGRLLLLQLLGHVFSVTDLRNDVVTSATLLLSECIGRCPVSTVKDVASGVLACNVLLFYTADTKRFIPELFMFTHGVTGLFLPVGAVQEKNYQPTINFRSLGWLREKASLHVTGSSGCNKLDWTAFDAASTQSESSSAVGVLQSVYVLVDALLARYEDSSALTELFAPLVTSLRNMRPQDAPVLTTFTARHVQLLDRLITATESNRETRQPLQWDSKKTTSINMQNPRYALDYTFKKDIDPDEDRVRLKQLNRQLKREKKAAMRELRRDSDYIDQERHKEVTEAKDKRREERVKNYGWMEAEQASVNMQVRQGKGLMKGGGSNVDKKARVKRL